MLHDWLDELTGAERLTGTRSAFNQITESDAVRGPALESLDA